MTTKFAASVDYKITLNRMKAEFDKKWKDLRASNADKLKEFQDIRVLGSGAFGVVVSIGKSITYKNNTIIKLSYEQKLVKNKTTGDYFAMKLLLKEKIIKQKQVVHTMNEKKILHCIDFPFLVTLENAFKDNTTLYIVMPFINGGEMFTLLRK